MKNGAYLDIEDYNDKTTLAWATNKGYQKIVEYLQSLSAK